MTEVARLAHWVAVMKDGRIVEQGPASQVLGTLQTSYARELVEAVPSQGAR